MCVYFMDKGIQLEHFLKCPISTILVDFVLVFDLALPVKFSQYNSFSNCLFYV